MELNPVLTTPITLVFDNVCYSHYKNGFWTFAKRRRSSGGMPSASSTTFFTSLTRRRAKSSLIPATFSFSSFHSGHFKEDGTKVQVELVLASTASSSASSCIQQIVPAHPIEGLNEESNLSTPIKSSKSFFPLFSFKSATIKNSGAPYRLALDDIWAIKLVADPCIEPVKPSDISFILEKQPEQLNSPGTLTSSDASKNITHCLVYALHRPTTQKGKNNITANPHPQSIRQALFSFPDPSKCQSFYSTIKAYIGHRRTGLTAGKMNKILILCNPASGTRKGIRILNSIVLPMFKLAEIEVEVMMTTAKGHGEDICRSLPSLHPYHSILTISGDGLFHELVNGLFSRPDWKSAHHIPIGIIPSGTSNAISKNLDNMSPLLATFAAIQGATSPMDVLAVTFPQSGLVIYTHLSVLWAFLADIDIESEAFRWIGSERYTLSAIVRIFAMRRYLGNLYILSSEEAHQVSTEIYKYQDSPAPPRRWTGPDATPYTSWNHQLTNARFTLFAATNMAYIDPKLATSPTTKIFDGQIGVMYDTGISQLQLALAALNIEDPKALMKPYIKHVKCKAFALEPGSIDGAAPLSDQLILNVSGERVNYEPILVEVLPQLSTIIVPHWFSGVPYL